MKVIKFEGLGLSFNIDNVLVNINGIQIHWYAVCIVLGVVIALVFCKKDEGKYKIFFDDILELAVFVLPISIICARLYFVLFKLDYYLQSPLEILKITDGGLAIYGGIIGAIITICIFCKRKHIHVLNMTDYIIPYLALGQSIGRWGNFFNAEAHGTETTSIFRMGIMENGNYIQVHPTFLYESICTFLIFIFLFSIRNKRKYKGEITYFYFLLYGIARTIIEGLRTDSLMVGNIRVSQVLSIILSIICLIVLIYKKVRKVEDEA